MIFPDPAVPSRSPWRSWPMLVAIVALCVWMTAGFRTMPDPDAMFFMPQVISYARGDGLKNPTYTRALSYSPQRDGRHIWHGFVYQMALGTVARPRNYLELSYAIAACNALGLAATWAGLVLGLGRGRTWLAGVALIAAVGYLWGIEGRPETMTFLLVAGAILVAWVPRFDVRHALWGMLTALIVLTNPLQGALATIALLAWLVFAHGFSRSLLFALGGVALAGVVTGALCFVVYPYTISEWLHGIQAHRGALHSFQIWENWRVWFVVRGHFFQAGLVFGAIGGGFCVLRRRDGRSIAQKIVVGLLAGGFVAASIYFSDISGWYNIAAFFPLWTTCALVPWRGEAAAEQAAAAAWLRPALAGVFLLCTVDVAAVVTAHLTKWRSTALADARSELATDLPSDGTRVAFSKSLFPLSEELGRIEVLSHESYAVMPGQAITTANWLVVQQAGETWTEPPTYAGFELVRNRFAPMRRLSGRLGQWFQAAGYGYALYRRTP